MNPADRKKTRDRDSSPLSILLFSLIGATATTVAVFRLRRAINHFYNQVRSNSSSSWSTSGSSTRGSFREESWNRFNRRMQDEYEEEMERVERIRRMQSVFNRARSKQNKEYESWRESGPGPYQHFQRDDWYWKSDPSYKNHGTNYRSTIKGTGNYAMSHHYSVLGLDRARAEPYSDAEIKTAFRAKAMEFHPDQNQSNKEQAEAKFKEVMTSYEAIKLERKNGSC
ncbi:DnaJ domain-containing protein [Dioscorea alata]|uniref:DnaJ domain-containing protein n=1 Tax=Dioscorea alata TaxID=55571 RepID=A0ACB7VHI2_DIOAL|nr:DnaJ domain-containing protein [Dioscorea alata]